jgi:methionine-rich copper-binding protein CopC
MAKKSTVIDAFVDKDSGASFRVNDIYEGEEIRVSELVELGYLSADISDVATDEVVVEDAQALNDETTEVVVQEKKSSRRKG